MHIGHGAHDQETIGIVIDPGMPARIESLLSEASQQKYEQFRCFPLNLSSSKSELERLLKRRLQLEKDILYDVDTIAARAQQWDQAIDQSEEALQRRTMLLSCVSATALASALVPKSGDLSS